MEEIRKSAKTVEAAIEAALAELGATREEVDITVIDEGSKGFLGMFGSKDAVVLVKKNFDPEKEAETFLKEVFLSMGLIVKINAELKDKHLLVELTGDDMGILIAVMALTYLPIAKTKHVSRPMGIVMILVYAAYTVYLIMR